MPVIGASIVSRVLAHWRDHDAVGKLEARHAKGREQFTRHRVYFDSGWEASLLALLDGLQVGNDGTDIFGVKLEFRHIWVTGHDALS